jgi:hypothetical protein
MTIEDRRVPHSFQKEGKRLDIDDDRWVALFMGDTPEDGFGFVFENMGIKTYLSVSREAFSAMVHLVHESDAEEFNKIFSIEILTSMHRKEVEQNGE